MWDIVSKHAWDELNARYSKELFGDSNIAPAGFREVTIEEFCHSHYYIDYTPAAIGYNQITKLNDGTATSKRITVNMQINSFGHGWAMERRHSENKVVYYLFELCKHDYETTTRGRCYWEGRCKKCGMKHAVDSSD